jgi:hypothetical protein
MENTLTDLFIFYVLPVLVILLYTVYYRKYAFYRIQDEQPEIGISTKVSRGKTPPPYPNGWYRLCRSGEIKPQLFVTHYRQVGHGNQIGWPLDHLLQGRRQQGLRTQLLLRSHGGQPGRWRKSEVWKLHIVRSFLKWIDVPSMAGPSTERPESVSTRKLRIPR